MADDAEERRANLSADVCRLEAPHRVSGVALIVVGCTPQAYDQSSSVADGQASAIIRNVHHASWNIAMRYDKTSAHSAHFGSSDPLGGVFTLVGNAHDLGLSANLRGPDCPAHVLNIGHIGGFVKHFEVPGRPATTFEVIEEPAAYIGRRAYIKGTTRYLDMAQFDAGLVNLSAVGKITRTPA